MGNDGCLGRGQEIRKPMKHCLSHARVGEDRRKTCYNDSQLLITANISMFQQAAKEWMNDSECCQFLGSEVCAKLSIL